MNRNYDVITFFPEYIYFKKAYFGSNFADTIKISTIFIKTIYGDFNKVKRIRNYKLKCNLVLYFLI